MEPKKILGFMITVIFLFSGCASNRQQGQVKIGSMEIKIDYSKVDVDKIVSQLSKQISSTMQEQQKKRVAVMTLTLPTGEITELGIYLSEKLTNSLFQYKDQFEVVERTRIESVFKEMQLGFTGVIDNQTAQSVGKIVGADAIVIGTITDLKKEVDINIRMLGTERANVIAAASSLLEKNEAIDRLIKNIITKSGEVIVKEQKTTPAVKPVEKKIPEQQKVTENTPITKEKSLVAYYPFNGNANDESGNGNNGTLHGNAVISSGVIGNGLVLDGSGDYMDLENPSKITAFGSNSFSICSWIKTNSTVTRKEIVSLGNPSPSLNQNEYFYIDTANQVASGLAYTYGPTSTVTVTDGNWHFVCVVNNANIFQIYFDGTASGNSQAMSPNISSGSVHIGTIPEASAYFFNGSIDEVRIYNRALFDFEIQEFYKSGL